jgi:uncharacterized protein YegJ (DUF2314 family)
MRRPHLLLAALALGAMPAGCHKQSDRVVRSGEPDVIHPWKDDREMDTAMRRAGETVPTFVKALEAPPPRARGFAIKKAFTDGKKTEFIWLNEVTLVGTDFRATVNNVPAWLATPKLGDLVTVPKKDVVDWMYVDDGVLVGGFTIRVLFSRETPAKQRELEAQARFKVLPL